MKNRKHSEGFKAKVLKACERRDAVIAEVALKYGVHVNLLHKWRGQQRSRNLVNQGRDPLGEFVPIAMPICKEAVGEEIRIECRAKACELIIRWPLSGAKECGAWLEGYLK